MVTDSMDTPWRDRLLAHHDNGQGAPLLTIAIPHYRHRPYVEVVLASIFAQTFQDMEIVVSDDGSPDDSAEALPPLLYASGRSFRYYRQPVNLGYDGNVRFCLSAARGRYIFLLGNDDALGKPDILSQVARALSELEWPLVAFTNFEDWATGRVERRAYHTRILGSGLTTAATYYRSFSFVSGLLFDRTAAHQHETDRWDRSIYYQIYLACRILAAGGQLGALDLAAVRKDVRLNGEGVPNYASKARQSAWSFQPRSTGLDSVLRVAVDGVGPYAPRDQRSHVIRNIIAQALTITYPYWLFEYRRVANWSYAVGIARGLWPGHLLPEYGLTFADRLYLWGAYGAATLGGLLIPARLFNAGRARLADLVRRRRQRQV